MKLNTIEESCKQEKCEKAIYAMLPFFHDTLILGDSLAESLLDFRLLRKNNVVAKRGRCIDGIDGDLLMAYALQPKIVFMEYGKNDIRHFHGDYNAFITIYKKRIRQLLDNGVEKVYVNSIIPMRRDVELMFGGREAFLKFNDALKGMCEELDITYIDNTMLMSWEDDEFEYDGFHPKYPYYQKWLMNIMQCANLRKE